MLEVSLRDGSLSRSLHFGRDDDVVSVEMTMLLMGAFYGGWGKVRPLWDL